MGKAFASIKQGLTEAIDHARGPAMTFTFDAQHRDELCSILGKAKVREAAIESAIAQLEAHCSAAIQKARTPSQTNRQTMQKDMRQLIKEEPDHRLVTGGFAKMLSQVRLPRGLMPQHRRTLFVCAVRYVLVRAGLKNATGERSHLVQALDCVLRGMECVLKSRCPFPHSGNAARNMLRDVEGLPLFPLPIGPAIAIHQSDIDRAAIAELPIAARRAVKLALAASKARSKKAS
jgi:hypothetical protein